MIDNRPHVVGLPITDHTDQDNSCNLENVCNPYTGTSVKLPRMSMITELTDRCIVVGNNNKINYSYKFVALGWKGRGIYPLHQFEKFYDSSKRAWKVARSFHETIKFRVRNYDRPYVAPDICVIAIFHYILW